MVMLTTMMIGVTGQFVQLGRVAVGITVFVVFSTDASNNLSTIC